MQFSDSRSEERNDFVEKLLGDAVASEFTSPIADPSVVENRTGRITKVAVTDRRTTVKNDLAGREPGGELSVIVLIQCLVDEEVRERIADDLALAIMREHEVLDSLARSIPRRRNGGNRVKACVNFSHSLFAAPVTSDLFVVSRWPTFAIVTETRI